MPLGRGPRNVRGALCRGRRTRRPAWRHTLSGDCRAACPQAAAGVKTPPCNANRKREMPLGRGRRNVRGVPCRGRRPRRPAWRHTLSGDCRAACPQAAAGVKTPPCNANRKREMPLGRGRRNVRGVPCRGRRPRRPAWRHTLSGDCRAACTQAAAEGSRSLPTMQTGKGGCR